MDLLNLKNPTDGQLIYMRGIYSEETLIEYMAWKWTKKFNTRMTNKDWEQWKHELDYLNLDSLKVLKEIPDFYII